MSRPPCGYDGILNGGKATEEWQADHWDHSQRKLKIYILGFLYVDRKPENTNNLSTI